MVAASNLRLISLGLEGTLLQNEGAISQVRAAMLRECRAKVPDFAYRDDNSAVDLWGDDQRPGFMWAEINLETDVFKGEWYDLDGNLDYIHSFSK